MSGPIPGDQIPSLTIPQGRLCFWTASTQSSAEQYAVLTDSQGTQIMVVSGASRPAGTGNPTPLGSGFFTANDPTNTFNIKIGTWQGQRWSNVLWEYNELDISSEKILEQYVFTAEDWTDADYNDIFLAIWWFKSVG